MHANSKIPERVTAFSRQAERIGLQVTLDNVDYVLPFLRVFVFYYPSFFLEIS